MAMYINFVTAPYAAPVTSMAMLFFYSGLTSEVGWAKRSVPIISAEFILRLYAGKRACATPKFILTPVYHAV
ncbi:MAG: hypothetical protein ABIJ50_08600 [Pseudomonadota bacterium]